eukprot:280910-Chlamydomonas_euryale.AAC.1
MRAKPVWVALGSWTGHPWQALFLHKLAGARRSNRMPPPGAAWIVTCPDGGDMARIATPSYAASADAFKALPLARVLRLDC